MTAFISVIPVCDGRTSPRGSVKTRGDCSHGTGAVWLPGLAWPLARLPGILGFFLVFHLSPQTSWGALPKPTTGPLPGTVASCVAFSLFMMAGVNVSDTAIGGLPGLQIFTFSVASPHPASITFLQEFCFLSQFLPPKIWGRGADSGLQPNTCPKAKIPHEYVSQVLWGLKNMERAAEKSQSGWAGGAQRQPSASTLRHGGQPS